MNWAVHAIVAIAAAYQLLSLAASLRFALSRKPPAKPGPPVSVLKPAHSADAGFVLAQSSHLQQDYPEFELLIGSRNPDLPVFGKARLIPVTTDAPNAKAGALIDLAREAKYGILVANDADIRVPQGYLAAVTAPLADPAVGLVTCLYRAHGESFPAKFEALGVATDFAPSALVAPLVGVDEFAFGSTLAFRRSDLERIGGFEAVADYLADDYQLGHKLHGLGLKCVMSHVVVDTGLGGGGWRDVWRHQVRWARTIRVSRFDGYIGLPVTFATLWALLADLAGHPWLGLALLGVRLAAAGAAVWALKDGEAARLLPMTPARDLFGVAVWVVALLGNRVEWRGVTLRLDARDGRILR